MTTIAMILGMLPSAMGTGEGSEFRSPISIATIGGLITSTLLTLVVVPVAYLLLEGAVARFKIWRQAPMPAGLRTAARVTGVLVLLALVGAFLSVASAFAQVPSPVAAPLTIEHALDLAAARNEGLKGTRERFSESQANVLEARAAFLPSLDFNFLYTPLQESPILRIPAGNLCSERADVSRQPDTCEHHAFGCGAASLHRRPPLARVWSAGSRK